MKELEKWIPEDRQVILAGDTSSACRELVRMIVTRDPKGRFEDRAYFTTDPEMTTEYIARTFSLRWNPLPASPGNGGGAGTLHGLYENGETLA